jgi:hypothetical protein
MKKVIKLGMCLFFMLMANLCFAWELRPIPSPESPVGGFGGGPQPMPYFKPSLSELNSYLEDNNYDKIDLLRGMGGTCRWSLNENWQIGMAGGGFWGKSSNTSVDRVKDTFLSGCYCMVLGMYRIPKGRWDLNIGAGLGRIRASYQLHDSRLSDGGDVKEIHARGSNWMTQVFVGAAYRIAGIFSVGAELAYMYANIDEIKRGGRTVSNLPEIELSGLMIRVGPRFHF